MPEYSYQHPKTDEIISVIQTMTEPHVYMDKDGLEWNRIFHIPQASVKENFNHNDPAAFVNATGKMKGTVGDVMDKSEELSAKRAAESPTGRDPVKDKYFDSYSKKRKGKKHQDDKRGHITGPIVI